MNEVDKLIARLDWLIDALHEIGFRPSRELKERLKRIREE